MPSTTLAPPIEELSTQLVALVRAMKDLHTAIVASGEHQLEITAVALLARVEDLAPARPSAVATAVGLDLSTVSRQVTALERAGWLVRTTDPDDRRAQLLELTPAGAAVLDDVRRTRVEVLTALLPDWEPAELTAFAAQLQRFTAAVTTPEESA